MREKMPLVCSDDYGKDEASSQVRKSRDKHYAGVI